MEPEHRHLFVRSCPQIAEQQPVPDLMGYGVLKVVIATLDDGDVGARRQVGTRSVRLTAGPPRPSNRPESVGTRACATGSQKHVRLDDLAAGSKPERCLSEVATGGQVAKADDVLAVTAHGRHGRCPFVYEMHVGNRGLPRRESGADGGDDLRRPKVGDRTDRVDSIADDRGAAAGPRPARCMREIGVDG
jgi:hypothetical protein